MAGKYFLGIDAGQTAVKAVLHDDTLQPLTIARGKSPNSQPEERMVERSHDDLWKAAEDAITGVLKESGVNAADIAGIGITGHGDGLHLVDANGGPVGQAIMAVDSRAWSEMDAILANEPLANEILELTGQVPFLGSPGILLQWMAKHRPADMAKAKAFLSCKDVLRSRLTGDISTDYSDASASFLDVDQAEWSQRALELYGLSEFSHLLPPLHASSDVVGHVTTQAAALTGLAEGTPVVSGSHDVHSAAVGMGALTEDSLVLVAGSFSINGVVTRGKARDPRWQSRLSVAPELRIAMSTSATSTTTLEWLLKTLDVTTEAQRDALFAEAATITPGFDYPALTPYVFASPFGEKPSGSYVGLRSWHGPADMLRATLDGIIYMHVWHTKALADAFTWPAGIRLGGGLARSELYSQMVADALGNPLEVVSHDETGDFGAAALAAAGVGHIDTPQDSAQWVAVERTHEPHAEGRRYWEDRTVKYEMLHRQLDPVWSSWSNS
jgi:L-xylulokinase